MHGILHEDAPRLTKTVNSVTCTQETVEKYGYDAKAVIRTKTVFNMPLKLKEPSLIFTSSLTDFFHEEIDSYRDEAWEIIRKCPQHTFQILTKRPERINEHLPKDWGQRDGIIMCGWEQVLEAPQVCSDSLICWKCQQKYDS